MKHDVFHPSPISAVEGVRHIVFLLNLLQDVNILRPLVFMAARDLGLPTELLVTAGFRKRDAAGTWQAELQEIVSETGAQLSFFDHPFEALNLLAGKQGLLIAASESNLSAHKDVHDVLRIAPSSLVRVTLQHGFECVGFLQSREQKLAHGSTVTFGADVICGWCAPERLTSVMPSQRSKLLVTGPTAVLQQRTASSRGEPAGMGLVCENMHSLRLRVTGDFKTDFLTVFGAYCAALAADGQKVTLRPHPGGQYTLKNNVSLPDNVVVNNNPIYKVDLSRYSYGISAPSSILVDMVLAGIPTAVWQDAGSQLDLGNYEGLTRISALEDWVRFSREATRNPRPFVERQRRFIENQSLLTDHREVYTRFAGLLSGKTVTATPPTDISGATNVTHERVLFVANDIIPTLQLSFVKPLAPLVNNGSIVIDFITEEQLKLDFKVPFGKRLVPEQVLSTVQDKFRAFAPTVVVFCRFSAPIAEVMLDCARSQGAATIYHIDDDLLHIPEAIGVSKYKYHNLPERLAAVRYLLDNVDFVYSSTESLVQRLRHLSIEAPASAGRIYCAGEVIAEAQVRPVRKVGYMGIGHESDLALVLPALVTYLRRNPGVQFELFGSIPMPEVLSQFGARVRQRPKIDSYERFLHEFAQYEWDIGICPLAPIPFNLLKANTKWVEYTSVGAAVIASRGTVYDDCCAEDCGLLVDGEREWLEALEALTRNPKRRFELVAAAQTKLRMQYSVAHLREQAIGMIRRAKEIQSRSRYLQAKVVDTEARSLRGERILFIANGIVPTLQLSFIKPLRPDVESGEITTQFLTAEEIKLQAWRKQGYSSARQWIRERINAFQPTLIVFCRYSGPHAEWMIDCARMHRAACVYHIDDDLLHIPLDLGQAKFETHNHPDRLRSVRFLLDSTDLVYCSTEKLKKRLEELSVRTPIVAGKIYCAGQVISPAQERPIRKIGYMASADHVHNLRMVLPAIVRFLEVNQDVCFEFFGSIPVPDELQRFKSRIQQAPKVDNYEEFLRSFAEYRWDIGICPLTPIHFNMMKANTKWVEYTSVGAAVIAQRGTVYDECCADGCGVLADTEDEWFEALHGLASNAERRFRQVLRAQLKLGRDFAVSSLRSQVVDVLFAAKETSLSRNRGSNQP